MNYELCIEGAVAVGVAKAEPVTAQDEQLYLDWIAQGKHGEMDYLDRWHDVRRDPRLLLDGAKSVIMAAFRYPGSQEVTGNEGPLRWARYALGKDYHEVVRERLTHTAHQISETTGAACRVTVDTAPLRERYWAQRAGIGYMGLNGQLIVPGAGSWVVLGGIITTLELQPDKPATGTCLGCMKCVMACPGQALNGNGSVDARRCMSYLTIESRNPDALDGIDLKGRVYGCDVCQEVCPMNIDVTGNIIDEFTPRKEIIALSRDRIASMEQADFSRIFSHSAIKRTKLAGLRRNARS